MKGENKGIMSRSVDKTYFKTTKNQDISIKSLAEF